MDRAFKIGYGYDSHRFLTEEEKRKTHEVPSFETETEFFSKDKKLVIGGVILDDKQQNEYGPFKSRSDGDVLYHAVVNGILSALGDKKSRDIGNVFPNTDKENSGRSSHDFLEKVVELVKASDYELVDLKIMVKGKLRVDWNLVEKNLGEFFKGQGIIPDIHVQATSGEEMDGAGKGLGVEVFAICLMQNKKLSL